MNRNEALTLLPLVQRRDVREADDRAVRSRCEPWQKPQGPVAAAGAENRAHRRVGQRRAQLRQPPRVVSGQVAMSLEYLEIVMRPVAGTDEGQPGLEGGSIERPGGSDDSNRVAGAERPRLMKNR